MGKTEKTIVSYTCDRCGKLIYDSSAKLVARYVYMRVLRWWIPCMFQHKVTYLCGDCFEGLKEYLKPKGADDGK